MAYLRLRHAGLRGKPRTDDQDVKRFGRDRGENLDFFVGLHRHNPVIPQLIEHFFDVQPLQVLFIGNQDGQCFVRHGKPLGWQYASLRAAHFPDISRRQNQPCSPFT